MQTLNVLTSLTTGTTNNNVLANTPQAFIGKPAVVTLYGNGSAAGLLFSFFANQGAESQVMVPPGSVLGPASTAGKIKVNEDFIGQYAIPSGSALVLSVTNPTAGTLVSNFQIVVN
jgi:hypothetical protein